MKQPNKHLKIRILETVTSPPMKEEDLAANIAYQGVLAMPTKLSVEYRRRIKDGAKCADPLLPVYIDSLVEALAYTMSLLSNTAEEVPLLTSVVHGQITSRVHVYAKSKFARFNEEFRGNNFSLSNLGARKRRYEEYFQSQLGGEVKPLAECGTDDGGAALLFDEGVTV